MLLWVDDSNVDSNDSVTKNTAANFNNDLQSLLKLIILKHCYAMAEKEKVKVKLTKTPPVQVGCPNTILKTLLRPMLSMAEKESEAHQNTSGPGWVPQYHS